MKSIPFTREDILSFFKDLTTSELSDFLGISYAGASRVLGGIRHEIKKGNHHSKTGFDGEKFLSNKLTSLGIRHTLMPLHHPFDILLNSGRSVEVKSASHEMKSPSQYGKGYYSFRTRKKSIEGVADLYAFVLLDCGEVYIIPNRDVPNNDILRIYNNPSKKLNNNKYIRYKNAFDLLR